jgi:hypothetical protein
MQRIETPFSEKHLLAPQSVLIVPPPSSPVYPLLIIILLFPYCLENIYSLILLLQLFCRFEILGKLS